MHKKLIAAVAAGLLSCSHVQETDDPDAHSNETGAQGGTPSDRNQPTREQRGRRRAAERPAQRPDAIEKPNAPNEAVEPGERDNTRVNARDRDDQNLTPMDQGNSQIDVRITQQIRKAVVGDDGLSMTAKNVKIITRDGQVTLRGVVKSASEKQRIDEMARSGAGVLKVDNQLEVASPSGD